MPFLYMVNNGNKTTYLVLIGKYAYSRYCHKWWANQSLEKCEVYQPDIDLVDNEHTFDSEEEAIAFIKKWWSNLSSITIVK